MVIFKTALTAEDITYFNAAVEDVIILPKPNSNSLGVTTSDGRPCVCSPTSAPMPGHPGTPPAPCKEGSGTDKNANYVDANAAAAADAAEEMPADLADLQPVEAGSDQSKCMMLAEAVYNKTGEG